MNNTILSQIGLTPNESKIYLTFLKHKEKTAAEVARILSMDKSSCYRAVESLIKHGLLITIPRKRGTTHSAASPEVLKELMTAKRNEVKAQEEQLNGFIAELVSDAKQSRSTYIQVEKGIQAVRDAMNRTLEEAVRTNKMTKEKNMLSQPYFKDKEHVAWVYDYAKRRIKAGVSIKQLVVFSGTNTFDSIMHSDKKLLKEIRIIPHELSDKNMFRIGGDLSTITSFDENDDYIVITIKDKFVAHFMNSMFDFVWERSEKYL